MIYDSGLAGIQNRTSSLLRIQQQLASGRRILAPSDDPVAAARALEVTQSLDANKAQAVTRDNVKSASGLADAQLQSATDLLGRVRELTVQAGDAALSASDRRSVALELRQRFDELVAIANAKDGLGNSLFGGFQVGNKPFAGSVEDGVKYTGDDGLRALQVSNARQMGISQSGNDIFMRVKNGNGVFTTGTQNEKPTNIHTASIGSATITNTTNWASASTPADMSLSFFADADGKTYYDLVDNATGNSAFTGTTSTTSTHGALVGNANLVAGTTTITAGVNDTLDLTIDGNANTVSIPPGTYTRDSLVTQLQVLYDAIPTGVTVSASGNSISVTSNSYGSNSSVGLTAGGGSAAATLLGGAPVVSGGAAQPVLPPVSFTHLYVSGQPIPLSDIGVPFDYGASVTVTGNPISGDKFSILRNSSNGINTTPSTITHAMAAISKGSVTDPIKWSEATNNQNLELRFQTNAAGKGFFDLVDATTNTSLYTGSASTPASAGALTGNTDLSAGAVITTGVNDTFSLDIDGVPQPITIPSGTYTQAGIVAELQKQFDAVPAGVVVSSSGTGLKFTSTTLGVAGTVVNPAGTAAATLVGAGPYGATSGTAGTYTQAYTSGTAINLLSVGPPAFDLGAVVTVSGNPANGDVFTIKGSQGYTGNGYFVTSAKTETTYNTGAGIIGAGDILDAAKWNSPANSRNLEVRFWQDPTNTNVTYYDLVDAETEKSLFTNGASTAGGSNNTFTHTFTAGNAIQFSGLTVPYGLDTITDFGINVTIDGTPASGDAFKVRASESQSVFDTLANTIKLLESGKPAGTAGNVQFHNELGAILTSLGRAEDSISSARAVFGTHLAEVDSLDSVGESLNVQFEDTLSTLQDLDYAEAITRLTRQQMELQAAQQSFTKISQLSLFDYIR
jgi:flagellar hook-associated protein 3